MKAPGKPAIDDQHRVAEDVPVEHLPFGTALGARGQHVLLADLVEERVLGEQRHGGEGRQHHRRDRQHQVPEIVDDLSRTRAARPNCPTSARAAGKFAERAAGKQNDQQDGEQEAREWHSRR